MQGSYYVLIWDKVSILNFYPLNYRFHFYLEVCNFNKKFIVHTISKI